ncbi:5'-3' exoribonuclease 2 isoform X1 [Petromyzon marinus]|uniref:5'-3' exoribonuclease n=2 Tax=Petromyzon marinus TaxID=7757 RepID=A0AAJ7U598_PETMA|nr:5'-3' exoribonuclease 2 isoform X1 [Petromyzon marinus]
MGVPAFFRWLSKKYPSIVVNCVEEKLREVNGVRIPVDTSKPNPNEVEFDNLYLDMNGIIHPCTHPEDKPAPKNEDEMMVAIFEYIDRLFSIVRPRRLLYMAIDGVAPRAKMNQQRSRRFRASKEGQEMTADKKRIREEILQKGGFLPPEEAKERFDSNCITPGTEFMSNLAKCLRYYVAERLNSDPGWRNIAVILSDASVPGEGEHKIMDFIRRQRAQPNHDPNTHHCLCGADADLIMLGLATHEPKFTIIREEFKPNQQRPCALCSQFGHELKDCEGLPREKQGKHDEFADLPPGSEQDFIFLRLNILREYLERELTMASLPFPFDLERSIDDWVFMCFFVGNDFLPHLPSLEIREGAIDRLVGIYKNVVHRTGGYLTNSGYVNLERVQLVMEALGEMEDAIFKKRRTDDLDFKRRQKDRKKRMKRDRPAFIPGGQFSPRPLGGGGGGGWRGGRGGSNPIHNPRQTAYEMRTQGRDYNNMSAAQSLKSSMYGQSPAPSHSGNSSFSSGGGTPSPSGKRPLEDSDDEPEPEDNVRLWEDGWKQRYYRQKFDVDDGDTGFTDKVARAYVHGLCWVLRYYYQGCASWQWFYPFHYAPFASDFHNVASMPSDFATDTKPFKPLEQLMGVFPEASGNFLPVTWRKLMSNPDSKIIDFYPDDFSIDLNGKKYAWQGVALLPFVDERRLRAALADVYPDLSVDESRRNSLGSDVLFVGQYHPLQDFMVELYSGGAENGQEVDLPPNLCHGMTSKLRLDQDSILPGRVVQSPVPTLPDVKHNSCVSILFRDPQYEEGFVFKAEFLPGAKQAEKVLKPGDWEQRNPGRNYQPQLGFNPNRQQQHLGQASFNMLRHSTAQAATSRNSWPQAHGGYGQGQHQPSSRQMPARQDSQQWFNPQPRQLYNPPLSNRMTTQRGGGSGGQGAWSQGSYPPAGGGNFQQSGGGSWGGQQQQQMFQPRHGAPRGSYPGRGSFPMPPPTSRYSRY